MATSRGRRQIGWLLGVMRPVGQSVGTVVFVLVCAGDSLTAYSGAWPSLIASETLVVAAHGAKIRDLPEQLAAVPDGLPVVASVGTNDILDYSQPLDLTALGDLDRPVTFLSPMLCLPLRPPRLWRVYAHRRAHVRAALTEAGRLLPVWLPLPCWARDGIHPNPRGQARIAAQIDRTLFHRNVASAS